MKAALPYVVSRVRRTSLSTFVNAWGVATKHFCFDGTKLVAGGLALVVGDPHLDHVAPPTSRVRIREARSKAAFGLP